ncbi:MAG: hypothetical protein L6R41_008365 [Letrouitia leprolyta]|nr:MAG: hypothetical protein L6R41_008365 [Letrouitia leprolyta]
MLSRLPAPKPSSAVFVIIQQTPKLLQALPALIPPTSFDYFLLLFIPFFWLYSQDKDLLMDELSVLQRIFVLSILVVAAHSSPTSPGGNPVYRPKCWRPYIPAIVPATFTECREAINNIIVGRDPEEVLRFSAESSQRPDIKLPTTWRVPGPPPQAQDKCMVGLQWNADAPRRGDDHTTLIDIQGAAMAAAIKCVINPPHLGGTVIVGWKQHMVVNVLKLGAEPPENDKNSTLSTE